METVNAQNVKQEELEIVDQAVKSMGDESPLGTALAALAVSVRCGSDVVVASKERQLTPAQAAQLLNISRTHLYKIMDAGQLPFDRVGRDRRMNLTDVLEFDRTRQTHRRELAERFAHRDRSRKAVIRQLAGVDDETAARVGH